MSCRDEPIQNVPILEFDGTEPGRIDPIELIEPRRLPELAVGCFFEEVIDENVQSGRLRPFSVVTTEMGSHTLYAADRCNQSLVVFHPGFGAPLATFLLECLIALGVKKIVVCGSAGKLRSDIGIGHIVVPVAAVRDEGTSYHYLSSECEAIASDEAVGAICRALNSRSIGHSKGKVWTTDALFRETGVRISRRRTAGCLLVDMEAAALFAVAQFRNVSLGCVLYAGDDVSGEDVGSRDWSNMLDLRRVLLEVCMDACFSMSIGLKPEREEE